ncbi:hypothetical protein ISE1_3844 [plant metagenome]|uniref:Uncharacterized protein n=1 Tax=plant metagenome TaxID=1297885 RepID=A0A484QFW8_9ZZZZ
MGKILFWILLIIAALLIARMIANNKARQAQKSAAPKQAPPRRDAAAAPKADPASLPMMVRCAHCGIHLPREEALLLGGQTWCSHDHAQAGPRA